MQISILGCDLIDYPYYSTKVKVEQVAQDGAIRHNVIRVAQFHSFLLGIMKKCTINGTTFELQIDGAAKFQPIDTDDVAAVVADVMQDGSLEGTLNVAGPEVLTFAEMARGYVNDRRLAVSRIANAESRFFPPETEAGFIAGLNTATDGTRGTVTWSSFVRKAHIGS